MGVGREKQRRMKKRRQRRNETTEEEEREGGDHHQKGGKKAALLCFLLLLLLSRFFLSFPFCLSPSLWMGPSSVALFRRQPPHSTAFSSACLAAARLTLRPVSLVRLLPPVFVVVAAAAVAVSLAGNDGEVGQGRGGKKSGRPSVRRLLGPPLPTAPLSLLGLSVQGEYRVLAIGGGELSSSRWPPRTDRPTAAGLTCLLSSCSV